MGYRCATCDEIHDGLPMSFHAEEPASWLSLPEEQRAARGKLSTDECVIDETYYFLRGLIELKVEGLEEPFAWGVWVSISKENFHRAGTLWTTSGRELEPPYFGWLNTELAPHYPSTFDLKTRMHTRGFGIRPLVELEPTNHPLAVEQREGISRRRLEAIWSALLHV